MINKERGITLIALVVTIIVLIILATVSINMVVGENGLIKKAEQARDAYENSSKREEEGLDSMLEEMMKVTGKGPNSKPLVDTLTDIQTSTVDAEDVYGKEVTVPKGFKVKPEYGTKVEDGIVIEDAERNQFVWVPCTEKQYKQHTYNGDNQWKVNRDYKNYTDWKEESDIETNKKSVANNGGFYVGRFEAGVPDNAPFSVKNDNNKEMIYYTNTDTNGNSKNTDQYTPVSKQGVQAWNYIEHKNAVTVSRDMYKEGSNYGVTSSLIDGYAWDRTVEWIASEQEKANIVTDSKDYGNYTNNETQLTEDVLYAQYLYATVKEEQTGTQGWVYPSKYKTGRPKLGEETLTENGEGRLKYIATDYTNGTSYNSTNYTLSKRLELSTGAVGEFKLKNIYDMAGNIYEWTTETGYHNKTETNSVKYAVPRGGAFSGNGTNNPISYRPGDYNATSKYLYLGFRVVLYIN